MDFTQLLRGLPCSKWVNRFLIDLAFYAGRPEEAQAILKDTVLSNIDKNMRMLSLSLQQQNFTVRILLSDRLIDFISNLFWRFPFADPNLRFYFKNSVRVTNYRWSFDASSIVKQFGPTLDFTSADETGDSSILHQNDCQRI